MIFLNRNLVRKVFHTSLQTLTLFFLKSISVKPSQALAIHKHTKPTYEQTLPVHKRAKLQVFAVYLSTK